MFSEKMTREEMSKAVSDRIFERAAQDREVLAKFTRKKEDDIHPNGVKSEPKTYRSP